MLLQAKLNRFGFISGKCSEGSLKNIVNSSKLFHVLLWLTLYRFVRSDDKMIGFDGVYRQCCPKLHPYNYMISSPNIAKLQYNHGCLFIPREN